MVLPSDEPSGRGDVQAVEALIAELLADPSIAADRPVSLLHADEKMELRPLSLPHQRI